MGICRIMLTALAPLLRSKLATPQAQQLHPQHNVDSLEGKCT